MQNKVRSIPLALGLTASALAQAQVGGAPPSAEGGPYYIGARQEFGHYSNVRSAPDGTPAQSDTVSRTGVFAGLDIPVSRQRFFVDAGARYAKYKDASDLDNTGYDLRGGMDWQTIERLSGTVVLGTTQSLARLNPGNAPLASTRNLERTKSADATARLGGPGRLALEGSLGYREVEYSAPEYQFREYDQNSGSIGVSYRPGGFLTLRAGVSAQNTDYPRFFQPAPGVFESDSSDRRDIYLGANWTPTGFSTINARVSYAKVEYDRATGSDFSGLTGSLAWVYRPTGKLQFVTTASRDTGQESSFLPSAASRTSSATPGAGGVDPATGAPTTGGTTGTGGTTTPILGPASPAELSATDYSRVTNALSVFVAYELTAKVRLDGGVSVSRRDLVDATGASGNDRTTSLSLAANWTPTRALLFGCSVSRDQRSASTSLSSDYHGNYYACYGQVTLR